MKTIPQILAEENVFLVVVPPEVSGGFGIRFLDRGDDKPKYCFVEQALSFDEMRMRILTQIKGKEFAKGYMLEFTGRASESCGYRTTADDEFFIALTNIPLLKLNKEIVNLMPQFVAQQTPKPS